MKIVGAFAVIVVAVVVAAFFANLAALVFDLGLTGRGAVFVAVGVGVLGLFDLYLERRDQRTLP